MSTIKLNTDCICFGHLASNAQSLQENNAQSLQENSQSEHAYASTVDQFLYMYLKLILGSEARGSKGKKISQGKGMNGLFSCSIPWSLRAKYEFLFCQN